MASSEEFETITLTEQDMKWTNYQAIGIVNFIYRQAYAQQAAGFAIGDFEHYMQRVHQDDTHYAIIGKHTVQAVAKVQHKQAFGKMRQPHTYIETFSVKDTAHKKEVARILLQTLGQTALEHEDVRLLIDKSTEEALPLRLNESLGFTPTSIGRSPRQSLLTADPQVVLDNLQKQIP